MLKYAERFYKRQFINRKQLSGKTVTEFNKILQQYIKNGSLSDNGLPSVGDLANRLRKKSKTVSEIAFDLGFENMSYLSRLFKKETGMLPTSYKKQFFE
jgi:AraC family transcriptional activator of pobA